MTVDIKDIPSIEIVKLLPKSSCNCEECQDMCKRHRPCWGTPKEINTLIDMGYAKRLMEDYYEDGDVLVKGTVSIICPALKGSESSRAPWWPCGLCNFHNEGLCEIHKVRPIEAKIFDHTENKDAHLYHLAIMKLWDTEEGRAVVKKWKDTI